MQYQINICEKNAQIRIISEVCSMLFCSERAVHVSVDSYDPVRSWHLELEVCIVWYCIESSECGSSEQCVLTTTKSDDIED